MWKRRQNGNLLYDKSLLLYDMAFWLLEISYLGGKEDFYINLMRESKSLYVVLVDEECKYEMREPTREIHS